MTDQKKDTVLVVDDTPTNIDILVDVLEDDYEVSVVTDGESALEMVRSDPPDLILLDIMMPGIDGFEVCRLLKSDSKTQEIPVLFITALGELKDKTKGFDLGAEDYITKPFEIPEVKARIKTHLFLKDARKKLKNQNVILEEMVKLRTKKVLELNDALKESLLNSVRMLINLLEGHDSFLGGHSKRVSVLSLEIGKNMKMTQDELYHLEIASLLHDIGTITIPEKIQSEPWENLGEEETILIRQHPVFTQSVLMPSEAFNKAGVFIRNHLERLDGTGFPDCLTGNDIPLGSKIIGVTNAYDEMRKRRRFTKEEMASEKTAIEYALHRLERLSGKHFDISVTMNLKEVIDDMRLRRQYEKKINILDLKPDLTLSSDLYTKQGKLIFGKGSHLNPMRLEKIKVFHKANLIEDNVYVYKKKR